MKKREKMLIEKEILTNEELKELTETYDYEFCGESGRYINHAWYVIKIDDEEFSVYTEYNYNKEF